jgi:hypothetical protein
MKIKKNPGAVEAAHGASETDDLGRRVGSQNSSLSQPVQAEQRRGRAVNRGRAGTGKIVAASAIDFARAVNIHDEVARRGGKLRRQGHNYFVGPCLVCGGDDRFAVNIKKRLFYCRGCDVGGDVIDFVRHVDRCDFITAITTLTGDGQRMRATPAAELLRPDANEDDHKNLDRAETIWRQATALTPVAVGYFAKRHIDINAVPELGGLRFHPHCPWGKGVIPAIVGRFTTALGNEPRGIWRRPITGETPMTFGPVSGCVIRLWPENTVDRRIVLGEGVETVLAAATRIVHRGTLLQPAWAAGGAGNVRKFPLLTGVEALTLLVDNDLPDQHGRRVGQEAAAKCAGLWSAAGRRVIRLTPKAVDTDFNDVVRHAG